MATQKVENKVAQKEPNETTKGKLTLVPWGGLAKRIRTIASMIYWARTQKRELEIVWFTTDSFPAPSDRLFTLNPEAVTAGITIRQAKWQDYFTNLPPSTANLFLSWPIVMNRFDRIITDKEITQFGDDLHSKMEQLFKREEEELLFFTSCSLGSFPKMYDVLEPSVEVNNIRRSRMSAWSHNMVGVHINRSTDGSEMEHAPTELFIRRIQSMIEEDSAVRFFVASNSNDERERLAAIFKHRIVVPQGLRELNTQKSIIESFGELIALSYTRSIISTPNSSFSEVAAEIGGIKCDVVSIFTYSK